MRKTTIFITAVFLLIQCQQGFTQVNPLKQLKKSVLNAKPSSTSSPAAETGNTQGTAVEQQNPQKNNFYKEDEIPALPKLARFSTKKFTGDDAAGQSFFRANDRIYGRFVFPTTIKEFIKDDEAETITIFMKRFPYNGTSTHLATYKIDKNILEQKHFDFEVLPDPAAATYVTEYFGDRFGSRIIEFEPGQYKFRFTLAAGNKDLAWGELEYDMTATDFKKLEADERLAFENATTNHINHLKLPAEFSAPKGSFEDAALTLSEIRRILVRDWGNVAQIVKLSVAKEAGPNWHVNKDSFGNPLSKVTNKAIYVAWKGKDGNCYFTLNAYLVREYEGGGKYGPIRAGTSADATKQIGCSNIQ